MCVGRATLLHTDGSLEYLLCGFQDCPRCRHLSGLEERRSVEQPAWEADVGQAWRQSHHCAHRPLEGTQTRGHTSYEGDWETSSSCIRKGDFWGQCLVLTVNQLRANSVSLTPFLSNQAHGKRWDKSCFGRVYRSKSRFDLSLEF